MTTKIATSATAPASPRTKLPRPRLHKNSPAHPGHPKLDCNVRHPKSKMLRLMPDDMRAFVPDLELYSPPMRKSSIESLYTCSRMFLLEHRLGLGTRGYERAPTLGSLFHVAVAGYLKGLDRLGVQREISSKVEAEIARVTEGILANESDARSADDLAEQIEDDATIAQAMAAAFWSKYSAVVRAHQPVAVEQRIVATCPLTGARIAGTVDLLLRDKRRPLYYMVDHKTTSKSPSQYARGLGFDLQSRVYRYLLELAFDQNLLPTLPKLPVVGMIHNVVQKATIRLKQNQPIEDYLAEIVEWYTATGRHEKRADQIAADPPIQSLLTAFSGPAVDSELQSVLERAAWAHKASPTLSNFPRDGAVRGVCRNFFNRICPHCTLCETLPTDYAETIGRNYVKKPPAYLED